MANKITQQDIIDINEKYIIYKTYVETARQTGFSPSTIKKYIIPNYISQNSIIKKESTIKEFPIFNKEKFNNINWSDDWLYTLSNEEKKDLIDLWKELIL